MADALEALANMEYPGRGIVLGMSPATEEHPSNYVAMYFITGRSPSSQARRMVVNNQDYLVNVVPVDEKVLKTVNPNLHLLIYPAAYIAGPAYGPGALISNGDQTKDMRFWADPFQTPMGILTQALAQRDYEPDSPNFTPRIAACIWTTHEEHAAYTAEDTTTSAGMAIIRKNRGNSSFRAYFDIPLAPGSGWLITTYTGENRNPLPAFSGEPIQVSLPWLSPTEAVQGLTAALGPKEGMPDFRVAVMAIYQSGLEKVTADVAIWNRHPAPETPINGIMEARLRQD